MAAFDRVGLALWTMQSSAARPGLGRVLHGRFVDDARLAERLGFHAVWVGEHRVWYDGWCSAPFHALAAVAGRTSRIRLGTAIYLLPQHDPVASTRSIATLQEVSGGRLELGIGLGYRDAEFDALGLRRDRRGRLMDAALGTLEAAWAADQDDDRDAKLQAPRVWMGGMGPKAIARAAARGYGLMLPQTLKGEEYRRAVDAYFEQAEQPGTIGALRDVWVTDDPGRAARYAKQVGMHVTEEAGSWWAFRDGFGFASPESVERQVARSVGQVAAGSAEHVAESLRAVLASGVEYLTLRPVFDFVDHGELQEQLHRLRDEVVPLLDGTGTT